MNNCGFLRSNCGCRCFNQSKYSPLIRGLYNKWHPQTQFRSYDSTLSKEKRLARKQQMKDLNDWYMNHNIKMKSVNIMRPFVKEIQEMGVVVDCEKINAFYRENDPQKLNMKLAQEEYSHCGTKENYSRNRKCQKVHKRKNNENGFFEAVRNLTNSALDAFDKGLFSFSKSVNCQIEQQLKKLNMKPPYIKRGFFGRTDIMYCENNSLSKTSKKKKCQINITHG